jgi:amino acid adenylation domain-containing protein
MRTESGVTARVGPGPLGQAEPIPAADGGRVSAVRLDATAPDTVHKGAAVPLWCEEPPGEPGAAAETARRIPDAPDLHAAVVAAHAKVLAAVTGDPDVVFGLVRRAGGPRSHRMSVGEGTWRELAARAAAVGDEAVAGAFDVVLDLSGRGEHRGRTLTVRLDQRDDGPWLALRHHTAAISPDHAGRLLGYHLSALRALAETPDAEHHAGTLLSPAELEFQLTGLAGPERPLPDARFHELFERRVARHPGALAAEHRGERLTYAELNSRANRVARALLARGIAAEDVVAVVTERDLDWLVAVLAVFKAGGAYLPLEPGFPPERIAGMLATAGARFVLSAPGAHHAVDAPVLLVPDLAAEGDSDNADDSDPGVPVRPDQLAYLYFTSGSTGTPKGAMCEQDGMLNHLLAKIEDLGVREGDVIAQTAPQCFDISLWQLLAALLVGGRTVLVEQEAVLDPGRYLDRVLGAGAHVLQVVPSYLEVILSQVEAAPRDLGELHCVSVTGEALKPALVRRWFAQYPDIALVNAYGLTETSDDTNHAVLRAAPEDDVVPLGRAIRNTRVHVVDEHLRPVPLGSPGEIVFSGVCVGRGYVNDPERTRAAFLADPHHPGARLYRSGDFGRWLPGGDLGFAGRRDAQVKVRGFRIELGEIENRLLQVPAVGDAAVVVVEDAAGEKEIVACYAAAEQIAAAAIRDRLARGLPHYMVPTRYHWLPVLPLTPNGKTDKKALAGLVARLAPAAAVTAPATPTERRVAAAWAEALRVPVERIGRDDDFYRLGGTSLSAVRLVIGADRWFSLEELKTHPVLADLAGLLDARPRATAALARSAGPTPAATTSGDDPPIIEASAPDGPARWVADHVEDLRAVIAADGAVLVRGLGIAGADQVAELSRALAPPVIEREGFAPRRRYADGVYSSSEWPADQPMCMHHELSHALEFPSLMIFGCVRAPRTGGATALADARAVLDALPADILGDFERRGWSVSRNYNDLVGVAWADAFGATTADEVAAYCRANGVEHTWRGRELRTTARRPAVVRHPVTGERCWFNQAAFLNEWTIDADVRAFLTAEFGRDGLPFTTAYGDGSPIGPDTVTAINDAYSSVTRRTPWLDGDLLIVDNIRTAHSREAYTGDREVIVSMAGPVRLADCDPLWPAP